MAGVCDYVQSDTTFSFLKLLLPYLVVILLKEVTGLFSSTVMTF
jgi:hypothetical protein